MAEKTNAGQWQWQTEGTSWKGVGIYHVTLTVTSRAPLLGTLVIPDNDPTQARIERTELGRALLDVQRSIATFHPEIQILQYCVLAARHGAVGNLGGTSEWVPHTGTPVNKGEGGMGESFLKTPFFRGLLIWLRDSCSQMREQLIRTRIRLIRGAYTAVL